MSNISKNSILKKEIIDTFLDLVKINSGSDEKEAEIKCPSTDCQIDVLNYIGCFIQKLKLNSHVVRSNDGFLYAEIEPNYETEDSILFIAHVDTYYGTPNTNVNPIMIHKDLKLYSIESDKKTLLGADDKAGVAAILGLLKYIETTNMKHKHIEVLFTCDEETGTGMKNVFDKCKKYIKSNRAITVDGEKIGEINYECFNAAKVKLTFGGIEVHCGYAKNIMMNSIYNAAEFIAKFKNEFNQRPETTENREGFIHCDSIEGVCGRTEVTFIIRSFDENEFKEFIKRMYDDIKIETDKQIIAKNIKIQYENCINKIPIEFIKEVKKAYIDADIKDIKEVPIRGGTDGTYLSMFQNLPTINIFTGARDIHSKFESLIIEEFEKCIDVLINLSK